LNKAVEMWTCPPSAGARPPASRTAGHRVGFAFYTSERHGQASGSSENRAWCRIRVGDRAHAARRLVVLLVGVQNHGQGHETTLAQIAAHELAIDPSRISVRYGDTPRPPSASPFASRSIVFAGGAVAKSCRA